MLTGKINLSILLSLLLVNHVFAQFDIRITSAYGSMSLNPKTNLNLNVKPDIFLTVGLQADYYISEVFGIGVGADYYIKKNNFDVILSDYSHSYQGIDTWESDPIPRSYLFTVKSNAGEIYELNTISLIDFPVSGVFNFPVRKNLFFITRLGFKVGIPLSDSYILKSSDLYTRLYFDEWKLELFNIPAHGLYDSRTDWHPEGELNLKPVFSVFYEVGLDYHLPSVKIRLCGYFSYGLNNIIPEQQSSLIYWREQYNNILTLPESVKPMQLGIKIGIGLVKNVKCPWEYASIY
ncbi:MAG: outer membrane beta-barrel protein [Prolixibacteraceae bacterium]|nr:outer membrane beta-barrel protein [Prolixibacteraceae bacterium]